MMMMTDEKDDRDGNDDDRDDGDDDRGNDRDDDDRDETTQLLPFLPSAQPWAPGTLLPAQSLPSGTSVLAGSNALYPSICQVNPLLPSSLCIQSTFWEGLH